MLRRCDQMNLGTQGGCSKCHWYRGCVYRSYREWRKRIPYTLSLEEMSKLQPMFAAFQCRVVVDTARSDWLHVVHVIYLDVVAVGVRLPTSLCTSVHKHPGHTAIKYMPNAQLSSSLDTVQASCKASIR